MNSVILIGRLTRDPEISYTPSQTEVCKFTLAVDRQTKTTEDKTADFIPIVVWSLQGDRCSKYLRKGSKCAVQGRIETGSYKNKKGDTVYTTDVVANRVEFLDSRPKETPRNPETTYTQDYNFSATEDYVPF